MKRSHSLFVMIGFVVFAGGFGPIEASGAPKHNRARTSLAPRTANGRLPKAVQPRGRGLASVGGPSNTSNSHSSINGTQMIRKR